jgi:hypothetical protein
MAMWMLRYARCWQQQQQQMQEQEQEQEQQYLQEQEQEQRGAAADLAIAERLLVDGDTVGALLALCGPKAPLLLLPYAAQAGVAALLQPLALRRLLCRAAGFDLGGGARPVPQRAQVVATAKSALLAGRWADAVDICRVLHGSSWDAVAPVMADLQPFAVRRYRASVVRSMLAFGLLCKSAALCRAFRARAAGGDAAEVFLLCHEQLKQRNLGAAHQGPRAGRHERAERPPRGNGRGGLGSRRASVPVGRDVGPAAGALRAGGAGAAAAECHTACRLPRIAGGGAHCLRSDTGSNAV